MNTEASKNPRFELPEEHPDGDRIVIGGGCYGSYHARQLDRARARGKLAAGRILIVDRNPACAARTEFAGRPGIEFVTADWSEFYAAYFAARGPATRDHVVPTPISAHLMFGWLRDRAAGRLGAARVAAPGLDALPATPFAARSDIGSGLLSFATWVCPVTCIEPDLCPAIKAPKAWEMDEAVFEFARRRAGDGAPCDLVEVFRIRHHAFGVAAFPTTAAVAARERLDRVLDRVEAGGRGARVIVATVSSCHGVMDVMEVGAVPGGGR